MRRSDWMAGVIALLGGGMAASLGACFSSEHTCDNYPKEGCPGVGTTSSSSTTVSTGGTGGTGTSSGGGGTGGTTPTIDCSGDPKPVVNDFGNIRDECAVFVKAGATGGDGSMASPFPKIADALAEVGGNRTKIYVCTPAGTPLLEDVNLDKAMVEVFGGFDCSAASWTWSDTARSDVQGSADHVAFTVAAAADQSLVSGFKIKSASPSNPTGSGDSIGMAIADVVVSVRRVDVEAADAAAGADGTTPTDPVTSGQNAPAVDPLQANACINPGSLKGGTQGMTTCGGVDTSGGIGGKGGITGTNNGDGETGGNGQPAGAAGMGGVGQTDLSDNTKFCKAGDAGAIGNTGSKGTAGQALGSLTLNGLTHGDGGDGGTGTPGQGGGGGGGSKSGSFCAGGADGNGASGGGGGAGGCGGKGGIGGKSGGSSIAILSLGNKLLIDGMTVTLKAGKGGAGGKGGIGQSGGGFGTGAVGGTASGMSPSKAGCKGGDGGSGGDGGPGGGGRGGHSLGIVFAKTPGALPFKTAPVVGMAGNGGTSTGGNAGDNGQVGAVCDFSKTTNPCM